MSCDRCALRGTCTLNQFAGCSVSQSHTLVARTQQELREEVP